MATQPPDDHAGAAPTSLDLDDGDQAPRTLHDAFCKNVFGDPGNAAALLQAILPARVARHIDWTSLEPEHASPAPLGKEARGGRSPTKRPSGAVVCQ